MPQPDSEGALLDGEDWDIVFQAYAEYPILAFILAQHFDCLKGLIAQGPNGAIQATATLDLAIERLMPHTNFREVDRHTYRLAVTGNLSPKDDATNKRQSK
jgi:hypothetical protein